MGLRGGLRGSQRRMGDRNLGASEPVIYPVIDIVGKWYFALPCKIILAGLDAISHELSGHDSVQNRYGVTKA